MFDEFNREFGFGVAGITPARQTLSGFGYDRHSYISTAGLAAYPYTTSAAIAARFSGANDLIAASDDGTGPDLGVNVLAQIIANVTTEINGFISTIYPVPLAKTGTVAVIQITSVSADGLGTIAGIKVLEPGGYVIAPATTNSPAYLSTFCGEDEESWWKDEQAGTGASFTVAFSSAVPFLVSGTPAIAGGGLNYQVDDILVLTGGSSFVPDKITNAATLLCCYELIRRRITPNEQNLFAPDAKVVKDELLKISNGELSLDGTYKRFFSAGIAWGQRSVLAGANSL